MYWIKMFFNMVLWDFVTYLLHIKKHINLNSNICLDPGQNIKVLRLGTRTFKHSNTSDSQMQTLLTCESIFPSLYLQASYYTAYCWHIERRSSTLYTTCTRWSKRRWGGTLHSWLAWSQSPSTWTLSLLTWESLKRWCALLDKKIKCNCKRRIIEGLDK